MNINMTGLFSKIKEFSGKNPSMAVTSYFNDFAGDTEASHNLAQRRISSDDMKLAKDVNTVKDKVGLPEPDGNSGSMDDFLM